MAGKIFLFSILLVSVSTTVFAAPNCNVGETECKATPGCLWDSGQLGGTCKTCDVPNNYCEGGTAKPCPSDFSESDIGAESVLFCYKEINCDNNGTSQNCKYYKGYYENNLNKVDCSGDGDAHIEGNNLLNGICYTNTRKCENFSSTGCTGTPIENATYSPEPGMQKWNVGACKCTETGNYSAKNCTATKTYTASGTIPTVATGITYTMSTYYCTGCIAGHYVAPENMVSQQGCSYLNSSPTVCSCTQVNQGYYMSQCTWNYPLNGQPTGCVTPQKCPAGQTTNGPGATSVNECQYTAATKFCDDGGCFNLGDIQNTYNIAPGDWRVVQ
jgi:hypothetical protein